MDPKELNSWANSLIKGHNVHREVGSLQPKVFNQICVMPAMKVALKNMTTRVGTASHCRHVRLNLQIARLRKKWTTAEESGNISHLGSVSFKQASVVHAEAAVAKAAAQLARTCEATEQTRIKLSEDRQKRLMLEAVTSHLTADARECLQQVHNVQYILQKWHDRKKKKTHTTSDQQGCSLDEILQNICDLRLQLLHKNDDDRASLLQAKQALWSRVNDHRDGDSSVGTVSALARRARCHADTVRSLTAAANPLAAIHSLREDLRDKGELGAELDKNLQEMLAVMCAAHVEVHIRAEEFRRQADKHLNACNTITEHLLDTVQHKFINPAMSAALSALLQNSIAAAGERAALQQLHAIAKRLQEEAVLAEQEATALQRLQNQTSALEEVVHGERRRLECVGRLKESCLLAMTEDASVCRGTATRGLQAMSSPPPTLSMARLQQEIHELATLPMNLLKALKLNDQSVVLERDLRTGVVILNEGRLRRALEKLPGHSLGAVTAESVCACVCQALDQVTALSARTLHAHHTQASCRSNATPALTSAAIQALCAEVDAHDEDLEKKVAATLRTCEKLVTTARRVLPRSQRALVAWWDQPAMKIKL
ncbi:uncharacterized protein LOC108675417 [Hyalella azteca]|uniref:Uncharacterized protein LOC108675417 n=1 Tax=Hyalella azteca TaxID=294128 RepID=A0A8B7NYM4_HYAAZ|nr:uncharacterized protein LOC108675417 [Hyalella azteca]XP_018018914.1 uncharacterized protein LOC108675417 [Hyalella azteca]XP_018018915.1 uncharacterized protein LOC108675417 [Hyalella azteca]